ncbi:YceI family protein [Cupriavidus sp. YR651]|uniref:YceI family protein n=1 Tax=Cupriavidus sp. YR651 TaxID=1855315 RepID=UPI0021006BFC|nr:YceI family protein [Cupriavidus sp. YR651]
MSWIRPESPGQLRFHHVGEALHLVLALSTDLTLSISLRSCHSWIERFARACAGSGHEDRLPPHGGGRRPDGGHSPSPMAVARRGINRGHRAFSQTDHRSSVEGSIVSDPPLRLGHAQRRRIAGPLFATLFVALFAIVPTAFAAEVALIDPARPAEKEAPLDQYVLAPQHSSVTFDVDAFTHSRIRMRFGRMRAQLEGTRAGLDAGRVTVTIDAASVEARPRFLSPIIRGGGMLDVERYPEIRFVSTRFERAEEGGGWLLGDLTIRDITRQVRLRVAPGDGIGSPLRGGTLAFSAAGEVSRREFGFSAWFPTVGDAVHMNIQVEFVLGP